ncbi:hypothetical protein HK102_009945 [Quaeritorhiza haematococci]|nr:hypothetical protein HK102_009945 [Quaeritorhiza haematococci]
MAVVGVYLPMVQQQGTELTNLTPNQQAAKVLEKMESVGMIDTVTDADERKKEIVTIEVALLTVGQVQSATGLAPQSQ